MKLFFLSTALTDDIYQHICSNCRKFKPTFSGVGFDRNTAVGLSEHISVEPISYYPVPSYPKYGKIVVPSANFHLGSLAGYVPGMINMPVIKELCYCIDTVRRIHKNREPENVIVISGLYRCLLRPARILKRRYGIKIYAIVPDIPELMRTYRNDYSCIRMLLNKLDVAHSKQFRSCVDGFIVLSEYMVPIVAPDGRPWIQIDGMCDLRKILESTPQNENTKETFLLYAGKISAKFGVDRLIKGFQTANIPGCKLYLCGDGDLNHEVSRISAQDNRIRFLGLVPHDKVLELESRASLLVEPRPSNDPLTKFSFPSKILEYMASGTPVLTTNLPCLSEEYRMYQYRIEDESVEGISRAILATMGISREEREALGSAARSFISEHRTIQVQAARIAAFIKGDNS